MTPRALAVPLLALCMACSGSPGLEHASASDFLALADDATRIHSARAVTYVGASATRAYLECWSAAGSGGRGRTVVYWTELDALPAAVAETLRTGGNPWPDPVAAASPDR